ncbi:MAG: Mur ligase family protein [Kiritimatiellae bacterium]|nr:Mur ligase family protein [Kiritimatiellia bacterium]
MSALAQALRDVGAEVSGSDRHADRGEWLPILQRLRRAGVRLLRQDGSGVEPGVVVVVSSAIEADNADLAAAVRGGLQVRHRAEVLAELVRGRRVAAVAGTSGKTTVTGMLGWILEVAGLDPWVVNGGGLLNWVAPDRVASVRRGDGEWSVIETDESDRSLLQFEPELAIVTNISDDHFSEAEAERLFRQFVQRVRRVVVTGVGVGRRLGEPAARLVEAAPPGSVVARGGWLEFEWCQTRFQLQLPGAHNAANAVLAAAAAAELGVPPATSAAALSRFRGIERRLERVGMCGGAVVLDDYAHNPAKIAAAWSAAREMGSPVLGVWRPHGFGPLERMMDELVAAWSKVVQEGDRLWLLPVFYAGGTPGGRASSEELARRLADVGVHVETVGALDELEGRVRALVRPGAVVLVMGARDPALPRFARRLCGAEESGTV